MRVERISEIIRLASMLSIALPLIIYLVRVRGASRPVHLVGALAIVSALSDLIAYIFFTRGQSTVVLFNIYYAVLFLLLTWFYYEILLIRRSKATVLAGLVIYLLSFILVTTYVQSFFEYQTSMWTITGADHDHLQCVLFSLAVLCTNHHEQLRSFVDQQRYPVLFQF